MKCSECTSEMKESRGCDGGVDWEIGPHTVSRCPEHFVKECSHLIRMWQDWKIFGLAFPGHPSEQPHYIIDAIRTLENEMIIIQKEQRDK